MGSPAKAEPFFRRFPDIYEKRLGPNHPALARPLKNLARLYGKLGKKKEAAGFLERAKAMKKRLAGRK
ncbi:MAG: tetratricopeptide repeat protein [Nitrospinota bacterium]